MWWLKQCMRCCRIALFLFSHFKFHHKLLWFLCHGLCCIYRVSLGVTLLISLIKMFEVLYGCCETLDDMASIACILNIIQSFSSVRCQCRCLKMSMHLLWIKLFSVCWKFTKLNVFLWLGIILIMLDIFNEVDKRSIDAHWLAAVVVISQRFFKVKVDK